MSDRCNQCGGVLTLEAVTDNEYYLRSVELLKKPDERFKGEKYRYVCHECGKVGGWVHWDTYPDRSGHVKNKESCIQAARYLFEYAI